MLKITNTLTGKKEPFRPGRDGRNKKVGMYVCGVTVYDRCHLGHARSAVVFDVIRRYLEYKKYKVRYVKNFTDVDDKIINRANQEAKSWQKIAETYIKAYEEDMKRLRVRPADVEPRATEYIEDMIKLIESLFDKGIAYEEEGNVYFDVYRFQDYGKLSKRGRDEMAAGARVELDPHKRSALDFALWKASKPDEPFWKSPWGPGRPGWHIECSTMAMKLLGNSFDIHGGGMDLIFPHHENEIAQSEAESGKPLARYWVHNGFVNVNQEKMSKSLGNFFTIQEIFEKSQWPEAVTAEVLRYFLVSTHYRTPIDFSDDALKSAKAGLDNFYRMFQKLEEPAATASKPHEKKLRVVLKAFPKRFEAAMNDDFNTTIAVAEFQKLRADINRFIEKGISRTEANRVLSIFKKIGAVLGLFQLDPKKWPIKKQPYSVPELISLPLNRPDESHRQRVAGEIPTGAPPLPLREETEIQRLVRERETARREKDWVKADEIRKKLSDAGIILEDRPDGTTRVRR